MQRLALIRRVNALLEPDFEALVFSLSAPRSLMPSGSSAIGNRASALLEWVENPKGCGMEIFIDVLNEIAPPPPSPLLDNGDGERVRLPNNVFLEMIYVPSGKFHMGSSDEGEGRTESEGPQHEVAVPGFYMGKSPVTQKQWYAVSLMKDIDRSLPPNPSYFEGDRRPVESVNWDQAVEFCQRLSNYTGNKYRLPSEAEWEYACRANTYTPYTFGETITNEQAAYGRCLKQGTVPVEQYSANAFGLHDMHGNVWEWCQDHWHENYDGAPTDGSAWVTERDNGWRVRRGGSWSLNPENCRSATRIGNNPEIRSYRIGLRVVYAYPKQPS